MYNIDEFARRYLAQWEKRATVRGAPRYRVPPGEGPKVQVPASVFPWAGHPAIQALGPDVLATLLAREAFQWQSMVANAEVDIMTVLCGQLGTGGFDFPLPAAARQVAITVATDETYHSYVAREFMIDVGGAESVQPADGATPLYKAVALARSAVDPRFSAEAQVMALCFCENLVTEELLGYSRHDGNPTPFHIIMREHLVDEGRHQRFFTVMLAHMWATMSAPCREALVAILPTFLDTLLYDPEGRGDSFVKLLESIGLDAPTAREIYDDSRPPEQPRFMRRSSAQTMKLLGAAGLDRDPGASSALIRAGWLPQPVAA